MVSDILNANNFELCGWFFSNFLGDFCIIFRWHALGDFFHTFLVQVLYQHWRHFGCLFHNSFCSCWQFFSYFFSPAFWWFFVHREIGFSLFQQSKQFGRHIHIFGDLSINFPARLWWFQCITAIRQFGRFFGVRPSLFGDFSASSIVETGYASWDARVGKWRNATSLGRRRTIKAARTSDDDVWGRFEALTWEQSPREKRKKVKRSSKICDF